MSQTLIRTLGVLIASDPLLVIDNLEEKDFSVESFCSILSCSDKVLLKCFAILLLHERLLNCLSFEEEIKQSFQLCLELGIPLVNEGVERLKILGKLHPFGLSLLEAILMGNVVTRFSDVLTLVAKKMIKGESNDTENLIDTKRLMTLEYNAPLMNLFPLLNSILKKSPDNRIIEPFPAIISIQRKGNYIESSDINNFPINARPAIWNIVKRYFDISKPTFLQSPPPKSTLRLHSEAHLDGDQLLARKSLGKALGLALFCLESNKSASRTVVDYLDISFSVKVPGILSQSVEPAVNTAISEFVAGFITGLCNYSLISSKECFDLLKSQSFSLDSKCTGLILALGLLGKLSNVSPADLLYFMSNGNPTVEAVSSIGLAASNRHFRSLIKLLCINLLRYSDAAAEPFQIDPQVRVASPLALGMALTNTSDPSISSVLFKHLTTVYETEKPYFDYNNYVLYCGIGVGLIGEHGLHLGDVSKLLDQIIYPNREYSRMTRPAAIFAISRYIKMLSNRELQLLRDIESLDTISFDDLLLLQTAIVAFDKRNVKSNHLDYTSTWLACKKKLDIKSAIRIASDSLAIGLRSIADNESIILDKADEHLFLEISMKFKTATRITPLDYSSRYTRLVMSTCHDIYLLGRCLVKAGSGDEALIRIWSESFANSLDHSFGRSVIQSLALTFLAMDSEKLSYIKRQNHPDVIKLCLLMAILPFAGHEAPDQLCSIFRLLLPIWLLKGYQTVGSNHPLTKGQSIKELTMWIESNVLTDDLRNLITNLKPQFVKFEDKVQYIELLYKLNIYV